MTRAQASIPVFLLSAMAAAAACDGGDPGETDAGAPEGAVVVIVEPADGAELAGPDAHVVLEARGVTIAPAADSTPGTAHHHLLVDHDLTPAGQPIPAIEGRAIHLGLGQTEWTLTGLAPGSHTVIAVLADRFHVPLEPPAVDTVRFVIRP